jgi:hypothetical protein
VISWFQSFAFKRKLYRYSSVLQRGFRMWNLHGLGAVSWVGLYKSNPVDP